MADAHPVFAPTDFERLADLLPQLIWVTDVAGYHLYFNARWTEYTGLTLEQSFGPDVWNLALHPADQARSRRRWEHSLTTGEFYEIEYRFRRHDGEYRWFLAQAHPVRDAATGQITRWFGSCTDIHAEKMARERLLESEGRFRKLVEATTQIVWTTIRAGTFEEEQPSWAAFTGQQPAEYQGSGWLAAVHPDDRPRTVQAWEQAASYTAIYEIEHRLRRHDGEYRLMRARAVPVTLPDGQVREWVGVHTDLTDERRRELHLRRLLESEVMGVLFFDLADSTVTDANDQYLRIIGATRAELQAGLINWAALTPAEHAATDAERVAELRATGTHQPYEKEYQRPDGTRVPVLLAGSLTEGTRGVSLCLDLTALKTTEAALHEREQELDMLANNIPQLAWITDETGYIYWYNQRWYDYTGTNLEQMKGWGWQAVHHPDYVEGVADRFRAAIVTGEAWEDTFPLRGGDGKFRWFLSRATPIRDAQGRVVRWFGTNTDVTQQRQLQDKLRTAYEDLEVKVTFRNLELEHEVQELREKLRGMRGQNEE